MKILIQQSPRNVFLRESRRGLSLMEILASVFILMIGLVGVVSVLPFGLYQLSRINNADYGGNCARAAMHEIKVRQFAVDMETSFRNSDPFGRGSGLGITYTAVDANNHNSAVLGFLRCDRPLLVDPLLLSQSREYQNSAYTYVEPSDPDSDATLQIRHFPVLKSTDTNGIKTRLPRITVGQIPTYPSSGWTPGPADDGDWVQLWSQNVFFWSDERNFVPPPASFVQQPRPLGYPGSNGLQSKDSYSWMFMLTPQTRGARYRINDAQQPITYTQDSAGRYFRESDVVGYNVDVIVFFKRNIAPEDSGRNEIMFYNVPRKGTGFAGGTFQLSGTEEELDLANTNWALVSYADGNDVIAKWYKIASVGATIGSGSNCEKQVSLLGADLKGSGPYDITIPKGAISVFSGVVVK